jgi:eukaryotic-like serine/threonine-protein kinase
MTDDIDDGATDELIGLVLADRYRILRKLGEGAMGAVYLGEHLRIGRQDAIKVLRDSLSTDPEALARFNRGSRNVAALRHPNICTIYDYSDTQDGLQFLAMEYIAGESLKEVLEREGALPLPRALTIFRQAASALQAAHDAGIVHRDLKPGNIMLTTGRDGAESVRVVDFDLAKSDVADADGESEVTRFGFVVGTPEYMSPEQLTGDRLDGRSDVYSLALVFCRMVTNYLPFRAQTTQELIVKRLTEPPLRLADLGLGVPEAVESVLQHALERDPAKRLASAEQLAREIEAALAGFVPGARAAVPGAVREPSGEALAPTVSIPETQLSPAAAARPDPAMATARAQGPERRGRLLPVLAGVGLVLAVAVSALGWQLRDRPEPTGTSGSVASASAGASGTADAGHLADSMAEPGTAAAFVPAEREPAETAPREAIAEPAGDSRTASQSSRSEVVPAPPQREQRPPREEPAPGIAPTTAGTVLDRLFDRMEEPGLRGAALTAIRDTAATIWDLRGVSENDRAYAAYVAGYAMHAAGDIRACAEWIGRALRLRPTSASYQQMRAACPDAAYQGY